MDLGALPASDRWSVVLASRAIKELRKLQRDQNALDIAWKKIRELSSGQFTEDNHTAVIGSTAQIPIYRARMSNDLRIIYHIDVVPDPSNEYDHQVIKILLIDARAHIDYGFWAQVASYLNCQGEEYRARCVYRLPITAENDYVSLPAKFLHKSFVNSSAHISAEDSNDVQDKVDDEIRLERYTPATKALYNSIVANVEVNLPILLDPHEREIINHSGATIVVGRSGTGKTTALVYKMKTISQSENQNIRQMFVTRSRVLARHVESSYHSLMESTRIADKTAEELALMARQSKEGLDKSLIDFDNELDLREDLPPRFSLLDNTHFPLFISFDKLCALVEGDLYMEIEEETKQPAPWGVRASIIRKFIGYEEFREQYWPQFKTTYKLGLNSALAYSEIMGVIKGSSSALKMPGVCDYLDRDQYVHGLAHRVSAQLDPVIRERIYSIFQQYSSIKAGRFELDPADRTQRLFGYLARNFQGDRVKKKLVDFLYVDEVQDNLMADVQLLRKLCEGVENTYWGGDTAQTIVVGSAFRIKDLGAYLYKELNPGNERRRLATNSAFTKFELTVNFRSHTGIVRCAASIVDSIYRLFPDSIDRMAPETARFFGPPPVVLTDASSDTSVFERFLLRSNSEAVFGAQQAILVRSEAIVEKLSARLSELCPILTITESKGLEFDDILLYDFFATSEDPEAWDFVHERPLKAHRSKRESTPPQSLRNDLKLLYVALTRARKRCWIWDHGDVIEAMKRFWLDRGLIATKSVSQMTIWGSTTSNATQWIEKGEEYFANGMYRLAAGCFKRGAHDTKARIANAYHQMSRAKLKMLRQDTQESRNALRDTAGELGSCARLFDAIDQSGRHLWFHAAMCLELAREVLQAAKAFVRAGFYERAIRTLFDEEDIDNGVKLLMSHRHKLEAEVRDYFLNVSRAYYFKAQIYEQLPQLFDHDLEAELTYARENNFTPQLKYLLNQHKRYAELARILLKERAIPDSLDFFIKDFDTYGHVTSVNEGARAVIDYAEWIFPLEGKKSEGSIKQLGPLVAKILPYMQNLEKGYQKDITLFRDILNASLKLAMAKDWDRNKATEKLRKILVFYIALQDMNWVHNDSSADIIHHLSAWGVYNSLLSAVLKAPEPSKLNSTQRLLGFKPASSIASLNPLFIVAENSFIYESAWKHNFTKQRNSHGELLVPARWIDKIVKDSLCERLHERLRGIYSGLSNKWTSLSIFQPQVLSNAVSNSMGPVTRAKSSDIKFRARLNATVVGIKSFAPLRHLRVEDLAQNNHVLHLWMRHLFDVLYPTNGTFETMNVLAASDSRSVHKTIRMCIKQYLTSQAFKDTPWVVFLSDIIIGCSLITHLGPENLNGFITEEARSNAQTSSDRFLMKQLLPFLDLGDSNGLTVAVTTVRDAMEPTAGQMDIAVLVHFVELITCQMIFHGRAAQSRSMDGFSGVILPFSWARLLSKQYPNIGVLRDTSSLEALIDIMVALYEELKFANNDRWMIRNQFLSHRPIPDVRQVLNLRLCWCMALLAVNIRSTHGLARTALNALTHSVGRHWEQALPACRRFTLVKDSESCLQALCQTLHHETLVMLSSGREPPITWQYRPEILVVPYQYANLPSVSVSLQRALRA